MFLTWRPMEPDDFGRCQSLLMDRGVYDDATCARIPDLWASLLETGQIETGVVEDHAPPHGVRIVGFVTIVFPSDAFVTEILSPDFPPHLNCQVTRRWLHGASPLLTKEQIRKANGADGVNLLFFHFGILPESQRARNPYALCERMLHFSLDIGTGYHVRRMLIEVGSPQQLHLCLNAGFHRSEELPGASDRLETPCLLTASCDEPLEGSLVGFCFLHQAPRLHFKDGEQLLLRRALLGESDEETARALAVSVSTVHKRWLTIYERAGCVFPELFPGVGGVPGPDDVKRRGLEKRRHLLAYVQSHREELRPYPHPITARLEAHDREEDKSSLGEMQRCLPAAEAQTA